MSRNIYIATMEPGSGKSLVVLGIMEFLSHRIDRLGFFRPVIRDDIVRDNDIELVRTRYALEIPYESLYGLTDVEARRLYEEQGESIEELLKRILSRYKELESQCDVVVCEGTDFTGVVSAFEFNFNARVANLLGSPLLVVANGQDRGVDDVVEATREVRRAFVEEGCAVAATVLNRVDTNVVESVQKALGTEWRYSDPYYVVPEDPALGKPTIAEIARALDAQPVHGDEAQLRRTALDYKVAAMQLPNFLERLENGTLVITPGDRADVIIACLVAASSQSAPSISGIVLTGGLDPAPQVMQLIEGLRKSTVPILRVATDTYDTAKQLQSVRATITADNDLKIATALGIFESHVDVNELAERVSDYRSKRVTPLMFEYELAKRARSQKKHIVLPEGNDERILRASEILLRRGIVDITILGNPDEVNEALMSSGITLEGVQVVDPASSEWHDDYTQTYFELRKHKGITEAAAQDAMLDVSYFGTMMIYKGAADGMVSGAVHTTAHTIRPALEIIRTAPGCSVVSSAFLMCLADRVLVFGDCAVNPKPNAEQLADIAVSSAATAKVFGIEPLVAMLSYSTGESGSGEDVEKVREATRIARGLRPDLKIEGPIQYDAAVDAGVAHKKLPESEVAGRATVFIFPDLNTGNNTYKAVQRAANAVAVGPVLQGLNKPVNDLSRGCTVPDIVNTVAITAIQAQGGDQPT